jgi:hypothetical protein
MAKKKAFINILRALSLTIVIAGAICSLYYMFNAGRNQKSIILIILFTGWVLSPFISFFIANKIFDRFISFARALLYTLIIIITIGSVVTYSGVFDTNQTKPAAKFLIVPLISWVLLAIAILITRRFSRNSNVS